MKTRLSKIFAENSDIININIKMNQGARLELELELCLALGSLDCPKQLSLSSGVWPLLLVVAIQANQQRSNFHKHCFSLSQKLTILKNLRRQ